MTAYCKQHDRFYNGMYECPECAMDERDQLRKECNQLRAALEEIRDLARVDLSPAEFQIPKLNKIHRVASEALE